MNKQANHRRNASEWQEIIKDQELSGQNAAGYCRKENLSEKSFYAWRKRLLKQTTPSKEDFIKVASLDKDVIEPLRIKTPGGCCVEINPGTESSLIKDVIKMLELK